MTDTVTLSMCSPQARSTFDFESLYRASRDDVYAYVFTMLRERASAEDVTSQAFERAYRKQRTYSAKRGTERAWLFGIARNAALDELRKRKRSAALVTDVEDTDSPSPDDEADLTIRRTVVRQAMASLAPREREIVSLKFHAGLDNAELARVLGVSPTNAGTLLHRAMTKLRKVCHETA